MERFLLVLALICTTLFFIQTIFLLFGLDYDIDLDVDVHTNLPVKILSVQSILMFGMLFGWTTLAFHNEWHYGFGTSLILAAVLGFTGMVIMALVMNKMRKLDHQPLSLMDQPLEKVRGMAGEVYTPISGTSGQVKLRGQVFEARTANDNLIPSFAHVHVVDRLDNLFIVERVFTNKA